MSSSERTIPHLRDIFGLNSSHGGYTMHHHHHYNHHYSPASQTPNNQYQNESISYGHHNLNQNDTTTTTTSTLTNSNNKKNSKKKRDNCKTLTSGDVKTLERHLSMKKTIRKKIMRDLQQAFVDDPNEFRIENSTNHEQLKAEIRVEALRFGGGHNQNYMNNNDNNKSNYKKSDNFLDMLRGEKTSTSTSAATTTTSNGIGIGNSGNYDYSNGNTVVRNRDYDYDSPPAPVTAEKQSFWRRFTMKNKTKR